VAEAPQPWDPAVLARVRHLHLKARVLTESLMLGEHRSRRVGQAIEFAGYQEYLPGMDLRHVDWRVWGRTDKHVVKHFETETELPVTIVLDLSADLATGRAERWQDRLVGGATGPWARLTRRLLGDLGGRRPEVEAGLPELADSKAGYALTLAATLAYFFHLHREPVGLELVAGEGSPFVSLPARGGRSHLQALFLALATAQPGGRAELARTLLTVGGRTPRRSLVCVITDGMEEPTDWLPAIAAFARRKTDLRFFHLYDRREWGLDLDQPARFYSPEGGADLAVDPAAARDAFRDIAGEYVEEVRQGVTAWGGVYLPSPTDGSLEELVRRGLRGRPALPGTDPFTLEEGTR
jgi:uncharacterized protein (DUF58 family)